MVGLQKLCVDRFPAFYETSEQVFLSLLSKDFGSQLEKRIPEEGKTTHMVLLAEDEENGTSRHFSLFLFNFYVEFLQSRNVFSSTTLHL